MILTIPAHESSRDPANIVAPSGAKTSLSSAPMQQKKETAMANLRQSFGVETAAGGVLNNKSRSSFEKAGRPLHLRRSMMNPKLAVMTHNNTSPSHNMSPSFSKSSSDIIIPLRTLTQAVKTTHPRLASSHGQQKFRPRSGNFAGLEGIDFVRCRICGDRRRVISLRHLSKHET